MANNIRISPFLHFFHCTLLNLAVSSWVYNFHTVTDSAFFPSHNLDTWFPARKATSSSFPFHTAQIPYLSHFRSIVKFRPYILGWTASKVVDGGVPYNRGIKLPWLLQSFAEMILKNWASMLILFEVITYFNHIIELYRQGYPEKADFVSNA